MKTEFKKRDDALDLLEANRADLIEHAKKAAEYICRKTGSVTAPQVIKYMMDFGWSDEISTVDNRFMGAVFRGGKKSIWKRIGFENLGSHGQPISVWGLK